VEEVIPLLYILRSRLLELGGGYYYSGFYINDIIFLVGSLVGL